VVGQATLLMPGTTLRKHPYETQNQNDGTGSLIDPVWSRSRLQLDGQNLDVAVVAEDAASLTVRQFAHNLETSQSCERLVHGRGGEAGGFDQRACRRKLMQNLK